MKKIILTATFLLTSVVLFAQEHTKSDSKWKSTTNGKTYEMDVNAESISNKLSGKPSISFIVKGNVENLTKIDLVNKKSEVSVPISKENQNINVVAGCYKFKFYHGKIGVHEFDIDLKEGDNKQVILSLK